jgi:hypothetical protein
MWVAQPSATAALLNICRVDTSVDCSSTYSTETTDVGAAFGEKEVTESNSIG